MHTVILAAGRARRLGPVGKKLPKCLLKIEGRTLIEYSLDNLAEGGASGITIITGHCDWAIQSVVGPHHLGIPIHYRFNPHYRHSGSIVSLMLGAIEVVSRSLLVVESDILYHPQFLGAAMTSADDTIMVADASGSGDEVFICKDADDRLAYLGKTATPELRKRSIGEYAGIARMSAGFCDAYCEHAKRLLMRGRANGHYEDLIFSLAQSGQEVRVCHCPSLPWAEVDTLEDLGRATNKVYPKLRHLRKTGEQMAQMEVPISDAPRSD